MESYEKPMCDCGEELVFQVEEYVSATYKIKKDGRLSKKRKYEPTGTLVNWGRLYCQKCGNSYEYDYDLKGEEKLKYKRKELIF
ncbi:hypothetical protein CN553_12710 [Bacillus cereus]|uniref:Uncharacterized protein n=1 Tax=Bacillus cereus TaxID=1396 RepID=A0A9X6UCB0_BACCE|nr:hypothetical protein [Bacillus cereus]EOO44222.1 hypothetical protein ICK_06479 [Bacillus cereus BAG1X2-2]EOP00379.1 hypothetical protein ICO_06335 [Bacillus cereus BAG2O-1]PEN97892.1 hypothetical protein CN553_12710 [Bacillus cereus]